MNFHSTNFVVLVPQPFAASTRCERRQSPRQDSATLSQGYDHDGAPSVAFEAARVIAVRCHRHRPTRRPRHARPALAPRTGWTTLTGSDRLRGRREHEREQQGQVARSRMGTGESRYSIEAVRGPPASTDIAVPYTLCDSRREQRQTRPSRQLEPTRPRSGRSDLPDARHVSDRSSFVLPEAGLCESCQRRAGQV